MNVKNKMKKKEDNIPYLAAIAEIEAILDRLGREPCDVDTLAAQTARARELIELCRRRLRKVEKELDDQGSF